MSSWRLARSLEVLRDQINAAYPDRKKDWDGTIGDEAHQRTASDHNPNAAGVVTAMDITHDPAHGLDAGKFADKLRESHDPRIKYVISNRRIAGDQNYANRNNGKPWVWQHYGGSNAHDHHFHVSVNTALADDTRPWNIAAAAVAAGVAVPPAIAPGNPRVNYRSLVGGFFSSDPYDKNVPTSIRSNNPGAVNGAAWEKSMPGYVGDYITSYSQVNGARVPNRTTIFETPENGVAVYWELLRHYGDAGATTVRKIIQRYGGGQDYSEYVGAVVKWSGLDEDADIDLMDDVALLQFAKAMFRYEAGKPPPWSDAQILHGFKLGREHAGMATAPKVAEASVASDLPVDDPAAQEMQPTVLPQQTKSGFAKLIAWVSGTGIGGALSVLYDWRVLAILLFFIAVGIALFVDIRHVRSAVTKWITGGGGEVGS